MSVTLTPSLPFLPVVKLPGAQSSADVYATQWLKQLYQDVADTMDTERSRQAKIGISEIGGDCLKCVCRKLSGLYPDLPDPVEKGWKAQVGTMGHAYLEQHFGERYSFTLVPPGEERPRHTRPGYGHLPTDADPWFYLEHTVHVDTYKTMELDGHCDLYIRGASYGIVVDWKFPGPKKLASFAKGQPGQTYDVQQNAYGLGWTFKGMPVTHVVLFALPRDGDLHQAAPNLTRFNPDLAISRIVELHQLIDVAEMAGWHATIRNAPRAKFCFDCPRYEQLEDGELAAQLGL